MTPEREVAPEVIQQAQAAPAPPPAPPAPPAETAPTVAAEQPVEGAPPAPPVPSELPPAPGPEDVAPAESKVMDAEWPLRGYEGPQAWEAENTPELTQNHLMISSGSAGPEVAELAEFLARLGYSSSISTGQNPTNTYDNTVADAVRQFCTDYGVAEDPAVLRARTDDTVGPWIWEALTRAVYKQANAQAGEAEKQG